VQLESRLYEICLELCHSCGFGFIDSVFSTVLVRMR